MDVREKLVELLDEAEEWADHKCDELDCETCPADKMKGNCVQQLMVDRLIAHGVTVQEDCKACAEATQNCIVKLQEQIAELRSVQEWVSVTERLPNEDDKYFVFKKTAFGCWCDVLGFAKDGRKVSKYDFGDQWKNVWYYYDSEYGYGVSENVTHWMPLPPAPEDTQ